MLVWTDENGEILGHLALLDRLYTGFFEGVGESCQLFVAIKLGAMFEATRPGED